MNPRPRTASIADPIAEPLNPPEVVAAVSSTRPRPPLEPKRAARRAHLKTQLTDPYILAEDAEQLTFEANKIYASFKPRNDWQDWLVSVIATLLFRSSRCDRIERKLRDLASFRAIDLWAEDQALAVENLAVKLPKRPGPVVAQLRTTPAGIDWLIARWEILARIQPGAWTEADRDLACLLLGGNAAIDPTETGFTQARIVELRDLSVRVEETDAIVRGLVIADLCDDQVPGLAKLRRDRKALFLQMKWFIDQFHVEHPDRWDDPMRQPGFISHDLAQAYDKRPSTWSFAEPKAGNETKPTNETNPLQPSNPPSETNPPARARTDERPQPNPGGARPNAGFAATNPLWAELKTRAGATMKPGPPLPTASIPVSASRLPVLDYATERGRQHNRPLRPGERARDHARRLKAARRRTNPQFNQIQPPDQDAKRTQ